MGDIIVFETIQTGASSAIIDPGKLEQSRLRRRLDPGMVKPAVSDADFIATKEHAAEPIKDIADIEKVSDYLIKEGRYRDNMLFILGINFGLRVSDLLRLRFFMLLDDDLSFRTSFPILEKKTTNTRKVKKNRYITINEAAMDAVTVYIKAMVEAGNEIHMDDYLFRSESNRGSNINKPIDRSIVDRILKGIAKDVGLREKVSTHTLRKTFGYHQMVMSGNDPRRLLLLQKIFGHSTAAQTLDYIGITNEEIEDAYLSLNLGSKRYYARMGSIVERTA